jgi:hypothetical protein
VFGPRSTFGAITTVYHRAMDVPRLHLAGGLASLAYAAAQVTQWIIRSVASAPADPLSSRLSTLDQARAFVIWLSFWALPIAIYALFRRTVEHRPNWARLGLAASIWFVCCELCYRTIGLFVVTRQWTVRWEQVSGAARAELAERIALWNELVLGWYVMLLTAHAIGLVAFACAIGWRGGWIDRLACLSLAAYGGVTGLRLVAYAVPALEPICAALYFPTAVPSFVAVGALLLVAARARDARLP